LRFPGARAISIADDGALVLEMPEGTVRHEKPRLFESLPGGGEREIPGAYRMIGSAEAGFEIGEHDSASEIRIDPVLDYASYFGGGGDDSVIASNGTVTVGNTASIDFPGGAFGRRKGTNVFVSTGRTTLIYGASGNIVATSAAVGNGSSGILAIVGGYTDAADLPTTITLSSQVVSELGAWQTEFAGGATDGFLLVLISSNNSSVILPTSFLSYVGTGGDDRITAVASNSSSILVAGTTTGRGLPYAAAPTYLGVPPDAAAGLDGFYMLGIANRAQVSLQSSAYFGGSGDDTPLAACYGRAIYIAGETTSSDFPAANGLPSTLNGASDAFLLRVGIPPATAILFGGSGTDRASACTVLNDGTLLVAGQTTSTDLPVQNAAQAAYGGGASDGFLAMFAPDLSALNYATYIGGSGDDQAASVAADPVGGIFVSGWTSSMDFPVQNAFQPQYGGGPDDGFLVHYDLSGNLQDSTFFGGSGSDHILFLTTLGPVSRVVAGQTSSADLPVASTGGALSGNSDGFVGGISPHAIVPVPTSGGKDLRVLANFYVGNAALSRRQRRIQMVQGDP
jgi:hypothetical protein